MTVAGSTLGETYGMEGDVKKGPVSSILPEVTIHEATPPPGRVSTGNDEQEEELCDDVIEEDQQHHDFDDDTTMGEEEEEEEDDDEEREMNTDEKRDMYLAVRSGDIDLLEDCLDRKHSDINMLWFRENLLMTAIRDCNQEMAEFLLDNGVDHTYVTSVVSQRETTNNKRFDVYEIGCRQMAYDYGMYDIVNQIDLLQNKLFPFIRLPERCPRYRRPKQTTPDGSEEESGSGNYQSTAKGSRSGSETDTEGSVSEKSSPRPKRRKKRAKKKPNTAGDETGDSGMNKTMATDNNNTFGSSTEVDSGHHSVGSSKLRIHMVREHDKLTEKEESSVSAEDIPSLRRSHSHSSSGKWEDKVSNQQSEHSETADSKVNDEGYGSISHKSFGSSPSPDFKTLWAPTEPSNHIRGTKSALSIRKSNFSNYLERQKTMFDPVSSRSVDEPLHWRKVTTVGSYAKESKNWHVANKKKSSAAHVDITPLCLDSAQTSLSLVSQRNSLRNGSASTNSTRKSFDRSSTCITERSSDSSQSMSSVASYMRPTRSTVTKQRLSPSFVKSYGGLEFSRVINPSNRSFSVVSKLNSSPVLKSSVLLANCKSNQIIQKRNKPVSFRT